MKDSDPKRILIIGQHFWPESFRINDIADYLTDQGHIVEVLCGLPNYPKGKLYAGYSLFNKHSEQHNGIQIYRSREIPRGSNSNIKIFLNYMSYPILSLFVLPRLITKKYDYIFIYQLSPVYMAWPGIILSKIKKIPSTMYVLDLWPENLYSVLDIKSRLARRLLSATSNSVYKNVDKLAALSESMQLQLANRSGKSAKNIPIIPQTCEKIYESNARSSKLQSRFKDTVNIVYAGNISPAQSFSTIIDAAAILKNKKITNIHWIIIGDGMSRADAENETKIKKVSQYFSFEGMKPVEDIPLYTNSVADILIGCLVKSELLEATIPAKIVSYLAAGKPVVAAMDGEVQTLINKTIRCGYATPTEDAAALANSIEKLVSMSNIERQKLGDNAKRYYLKHFERGIVLNNLSDFIRSK